MPNQSPEQKARDIVDAMLVQAGWAVQSKRQINFSAAKGIAVREFQTDIGPADYVLFVDQKPVGVIEAKREDEGQRLLAAEEQSSDYAGATLKYNLNKETWLNDGSVQFEIDAPAGQKPDIINAINKLSYGEAQIEDIEN